MIIDYQISLFNAPNGVGNPDSWYQKVDAQRNRAIQVGIREVELAGATIELVDIMQRGIDFNGEQILGLGEEVLDMRLSHINGYIDQAGL